MLHAQSLKHCQWFPHGARPHGVLKNLQSLSLMCASILLERLIYDSLFGQLFGPLRWGHYPKPHTLLDRSSRASLGNLRPRLQSAYTGGRGKKQCNETLHVCGPPPTLWLYPLRAGCRARSKEYRMATLCPQESPYSLGRHGLVSRCVVEPQSSG